MLLIGLGMLICGAAYFAGRSVARKMLGLDGLRPFSRVAPESYFLLPGSRRLAWRLAGPGAAYAACVVLGFFTARAAGEIVASTVVGALPDGPAAAAGMRPQDRVLSVGEVETRTWDDVQRAVAAARPLVPLAVRVQRAGGEEAVLSVTPNAAGQIRIAPRWTRDAVPVGRALGRAAAAPLTVPAKALSRTALFAGGQREPLSGPVGILREVGGGTPGGRAVVFALMLLAISAALAWPATLVVELLLGPRRRPEDAGAPRSASS